MSPLALVTLLFVAACSGDEGIEGAVQLSDQDVDNIQDYEEALAGFRDGNDQVQNYSDSVEANGRVASCAQAQLDTTENTFTLTLDFGEGCTGPLGVTRTGVLIYSLSLADETGFDFTTTFQNYTVQGYALNGTIATGNISFDQEAGTISYDYSITDGDVTNPEGRTLTINQDYRYVFDFNTFEILADGITSGTLDGESFTHDVTTPLVLKAACNQQEKVVPVEGVVDFTWGSRPTVQIDYGDGTCDTEATVSLGGLSQTITL